MSMYVGNSLQKGDGMRPLHWFAAIVICLLLSPSVNAADPNITVVRVTPNLDLDQAQFILSHQREEVFERGMMLDSKEWVVFWPVYDEYDKEKEQLDAKRLRLLGSYISKQAALTGDEATKLVKAMGANQQADLALRHKYFKILSKKLNPVVAARFVQLDDTVGTVVRLAILGNLPLISGVTETAEPPASSPEPASSAAPQY